MFIRHEINISSEELKSIPKIISSEKKLGFELTEMTDLRSAFPSLKPCRYVLTFSEIGKKGGEKDEINRNNRSI